MEQVPRALEPAVATRGPDAMPGWRLIEARDDDDPWCERMQIYFDEMQLSSVASASLDCPRRPANAHMIVA